MYMKSIAYEKYTFHVLQATCSELLDHNQGVGYFATDLRWWPLILIGVVNLLFFILNNFLSEMDE